MKNSYDQLKIEYSETDKQPKSVRLISIFLILIFAVVPLVEIVPDLNYNQIVYRNPTIYCVFDYYEVFIF
jgi:hypothetical protein